MFEIINELEKDIPECDELEKYVKYLVEKLSLEKCEFNIIFIDNERIHEINKQYRGVDRVTDVISFALEDEMDVVYENFRLLGDIYISIDKCYEQALEYGHSRQREVSFLVTHGILHLLGYDHMEYDDEVEMFKLQKELLDNYGIKK